MSGAWLWTAPIAVAVVLWPSRRLGAARRGVATTASIRSRWRRGPRRPRVRQRSGGDLAGAVAEFAEALGPCLDAGLPPARALSVVASAGDPGSRLAPVVAEALEAARAGDPVGVVLARRGHQAKDTSLEHLGRAWDLSESLGSPLAQAVADAALLVRERERQQRTVDAATAGARASMLVLTMLPLCGPAVSLCFGISPLRLYTGSPAAAAIASFGLALAGAGWVWSRAMLRRALAPGAVR